MAKQLIFYPDADGIEEATTTDGYVSRNTWPLGVVFSDIRGGSGTNAYPSSVFGSVGLDAVSNFGTATYSDMTRSIMLFDTSSLSGLEITSARLSIYGSSVSKHPITTGSVGITLATPTSDTTLVAGDYNVSNFGDTYLSDTTIREYKWSTTGYNVFPLNVAGIAAINTAGTTGFGLRLTWDIDNADPNFLAEEFIYFGMYYADNGSNVPKLEVSCGAMTPRMVTIL